MSLPPPPPPSGSVPPAPGASGGVPRAFWIAVPVLLLLAVAGVVVLLLVVLRGEDDGIREAYDSWNEAQDDNDCALYESVTTAQFRDALGGGSYACEDWRLPFDDWIDEVGFEYTISSIDVDGDEAVLVVDESYAEITADGTVGDDRVDYVHLVYELVKVDGVWLLDGAPPEYSPAG